MCVAIEMNDVCSVCGISLTRLNDTSMRNGMLSTLCGTQNWNASESKITDWKFVLQLESEMKNDASLLKSVPQQNLKTVPRPPTLVR